MSFIIKHDKFAFEFFSNNIIATLYLVVHFLSNYTKFFLHFIREKELSPETLRETVCDDCNICTEACPAGALQERELRQHACQDHAFGDDEKL